MYSSHSLGRGMDKFICSKVVAVSKESCVAAKAMPLSGKGKGAPYFKSPIIGKPAWANCARIWWNLPVFSWIFKREY